ncbi:MAG: HEPN domain-containing protein [Chloroflexi bacterium]|nr:HEPN domain-containing protein [Chloroflexota bacterium]
MKPDTLTWLKIAETDLAAAEVLLDRGILPNAIFCSHQVIEKLLKALWVETHAEGFPPRTHDLAQLARELRLDLPAWFAFLTELTEQGTASRYADSKTYSPERAATYLERTKELWFLLRPLLN